MTRRQPGEADAARLLLLLATGGSALATHELFSHLPIGPPLAIVPAKQYGISEGRRGIRLWRTVRRRENP